MCDSNYVGYTTRHLFQRIADHRYSAIGRHLRDAHGNIDLLNESQFRMLKKCSTKWDCLFYEMLYIRTIKPNLNTQSDSIRAKRFVELLMPFNLFISSLYIYIYIYILYFITSFLLDNDVLETSKRRAMLFYNILSQIFIVKSWKLTKIMTNSLKLLNHYILSNAPQNIRQWALKQDQRRHQRECRQKILFPVIVISLV